MSCGRRNLIDMIIRISPSSDTPPMTAPMIAPGGIGGVESEAGC